MNIHQVNSSANNAKFGNSNDFGFDSIKQANAALLGEDTGDTVTFGNSDGEHDKSGDGGGGKISKLFKGLIAAVAGIFALKSAAIRGILSKLPLIGKLFKGAV